MSELRPGLAAVRDLARSAQGVREAGELLDRICASVAETFGFGRAGISRFRQETQKLELLAAHGISAEEVRQLSSSLDDWQIFKRALETRDLVFIEDVSAEHGLPPGVAEAYGVRGVLVLPLLSQDRCIGFLTADHGGEPFELDSNAAELLRTIGALVASFLESALAQEELRRLDELKSNFIALASHELRTPAAVIYGIGATLHLRGGELKDEQVSDLRGVLYDHSNRLRQLVDQLLDLSRLEAKAIRIRPEPIQVRRHVEELVASLVPEHAAGIELIIPPELEAVSDLAAFDRIVSNLITNAFRYGDPPVRIQAEQQDRHFRLAVEDGGSGVSPEFVPQLFERFTRSEESAKSAEGAGLGLSIAQSFARAQGGDLIYKPIQPSGARFELVLPYPK
ncbi:MAG: GAF domain-containing protein [Actinobacteria bacterium]|nr:MAG: GAF domain-containing protein [Actinomycetota bacterium]